MKKILASDLNKPGSFKKPKILGKNTYLKYPRVLGLFKSKVGFYQPWVLMLGVVYTKNLS